LTNLLLIDGPNA